MRTTNKKNLEDSSVVHDKSQVAKKALSELIATKWKMVVKPTGRELALDLMADCIAKKGIDPPVQTFAPIRRSTPIIVRDISSVIYIYYILIVIVSGEFDSATTKRYRRERGTCSGG
jgi:hypothetical protein